MQTGTTNMIECKVYTSLNIVQGDFLRVRGEPESRLPEVYCYKNKPTLQYPAVATTRMKITYQAGPPTFNAPHNINLRNNSSIANIAR